MKIKQEIDSIIKINDILPKDMTKKDWIEDFNSLYDMIKNNYPYLGVTERLLGYNWINLKDKYLERIKNANDVQEYLNILIDAVTALQNNHTSIFKPDRLEYQFDKNSHFQKREPNKSLFCKHVDDARDFWRPIIETCFTNRYQLNFEVLITYEKGEYVIVEGYNSWKEKYGDRSKIIAVNDIPIDQAIKTAYEKGNIEWDFKREKLYVFKITPRHFGADAHFTLEKINGEKIKCSFSRSTKYNYDIFKYPKERLIMKTWDDKKIAYLRLQNFDQDGFMDEEHDLLISFYQHVKDYNYLIIDATGNPGGCFLPWAKNIIAPLINKTLSSKMYLGYRKGKFVNLFKKKSTSINKIVPKDSFDSLPPEVLTDDFTIYDYTYTIEPSKEVKFNAKKIILIDNITYSAADAFAIFCKETKFAKFYGTTTGGDGISESPIYFVLPNSKLVVRFQPGMGIIHTGQACEEHRVQPDVLYEGNHKELLDFVLDQLEK